MCECVCIQSEKGCGWQTDLPEPYDGAGLLCVFAQMEFFFQSLISISPIPQRRYWGERREGGRGEREGEGRREEGESWQTDLPEPYDGAGLLCVTICTDGILLPVLDIYLTNTTEKILGRDGGKDGGKGER